MLQKGSLPLMTSTFEHVLRQRVFAERTQHSEAPCYDEACFPASIASFVIRGSWNSNELSTKLVFSLE